MRVWPIDWKAWIGRQHCQEGKVTAFQDGLTGGEKALGTFWLTVFGQQDPGALMLPADCGRRGTDHVADDASVVAFVELLRAGGALEGDPFCVEICHMHKA